MKYFCNYCNKEFDEPHWEKEYTGQDNQVSLVWYGYCPYCFGQDYEEIKEEENDKEFK